jgi:hypothetical protein
MFVLMIAALMISAGVRAAAQDQDYAAERRRAFELLDESKMIEALPILEKLATRNPQDKEVQFYLGFCLFARSRDIKDPILHKQPSGSTRASIITYEIKLSGSG